MDLSDKAYSTYQLLKRFTPLMNGLEDAEDFEILKVVSELNHYLMGKELPL